MLGVVCLLGLPSLLLAQPADASAEETAWFTGEWTLTPAPVEGFDDIATATLGVVTIENPGGAKIVRHTPERKGRPAVSVAFTVKQFGKNFPWWTEDGGANAVARKVDENTFDLAAVGPMGRADWNRALRHTRVVKPAGESAPPACH
ncbi:MAG: hypothetical protein IT582_00225 [Opitutaceae bacterium]|nr:hypothetical protein [Opitutaceae bacterium]